jgi:hypothetical protein
LRPKGARAHLHMHKKGVNHITLGRPERNHISRRNLIRSLIKQRPPALHSQRECSLSLLSLVRGFNFTRIFFWPRSLSGPCAPYLPERRNHKAFRRSGLSTSGIFIPSLAHSLSGRQLSLSLQCSENIIYQLSTTIIFALLQLSC